MRMDGVFRWVNLSYSQWDFFLRYNVAVTLNPDWLEDSRFRVLSF